MLLSHTRTMRGTDVANFSWIPPNGLGRDSVTDRCTDDDHTGVRMHSKIILLWHTLTMRASDVASLAKFRPVVEEEIV